MVKEARHLAVEGFRNLLLVAGEHPKFVSSGYLEQCIRALVPEIPSIALEVAPMETEDYARLVGAGAEGLVVYQETYARDVYAELHTAGPKKDFDWRLACPERAYAGGFRRIGIGALFGLQTRLARGSVRPGGASRLSLEAMLEGAVHGESATNPTLRRAVSSHGRNSPIASSCSSSAPCASAFPKSASS